MAGSFTSPGSNSTKMKHGSTKKPRGGQQAGGPFQGTPEYAITDDFASDSIPPFETRHRNTNGKSGFNSIPARPPAGRLAQVTPSVIREAGKVVGHDESARDANSHSEEVSKRK
jgi:hypothetical protein